MVLLFVISAYRLFQRIGKHQKLNLTIFAIAVLGVTLLRNNGVIIIVALLPLFLFLFAKKQKQFFMVFLISSLIALFLRFPLLSILDVEKGRITEALSLPVQQVARTYIIHPESFEEEDKALLSELIPLEKIEPTFQGYTNDPIKFVIQKNHKYIEENLSAYRNLWIKIGLRQPLSYLKAWIELTRGYWHGGYSYWRWDYSIHEGSNVLGLVSRPTIPALYAAYDRYLTMFESNRFFDPILAIGLHVWALCILLAYHIWKKNNVGIFLSLAPLLVIASLWLGTPVYAEFRYAYCVFTCLPFLLGMSIVENNQN